MELATYRSEAPASIDSSPDDDVATFASLYERYRTALYGFCLARTHNPVVAEDMMQDVFAKAFAARARYDRAKPFWPWLTAIALRSAIDAHRREAYAERRLADFRELRSEPGDSPEATVFRALDRRELERALRTLPTRQQVVLRLSALDEWSYADIARQLGCTVATVRSLIVRGRTRLRETITRPVVVLPGVVRRLAARSRQWFDAALSCVQVGFGAGSTVNAVAAVTALVVGVGGILGVVLGADVASGPAVASDRAAVPGAAAGVGTVGAAAGAAFDGGAGGMAEEPWLRRPQASAERAANEATASVLPPPATEPGAESASEMAVSPSYEQDGTVFVSSACCTYPAAPLLLATHDGGATWTRPRALGFAGAKRLLFPPAYPRDHRLFAVGPNGVQISRDDGDTWETVFETTVLRSTLQLDDAVMSPAFNDGDPTMLLVAGGRVLRYRDTDGVVQPVDLGEEYASDYVDAVRFGVDYPVDPTVLVASRRQADSPSVDGRIDGVNIPAVSRCRESGLAPGGRVAPAVAAFRCERTVLSPNTTTQWLRLWSSPLLGPGTLFAYNAAGRDLHVSDDGGRTFRRSSYRGGFPNGIDALPSASGGSVLVAHHAAQHGDPSMFRSDDRGLTWTSVSIRLPGFEGWGTKLVRATPTGRVFALGGGGIACSADGARTWAASCPPH